MPSHWGVVQQTAFARQKSSPEGGEYLTLILLTWKIWWAPNKASRCQTGFNSAFKVLMSRHGLFTQYPLNRGLGRPQWESGNFYNRETSLALTGIPASHRSSRSRAQHLYQPRHVGCRIIELLRLNRMASNANKNFCFSPTKQNHLHHRRTKVGMETSFYLRFAFLRDFTQRPLAVC